MNSNIGTSFQKGHINVKVMLCPLTILAPSSSHPAPRCKLIPAFAHILFAIILYILIVTEIKKVSNITLNCKVL
ncbi:MAG: hypothetical protein CME62_05420 [Halobacteriovoraceae bacterium]|nr:hypothetical protein [Halobacteriovoraceae bacterium]